jgi:exosortase A-associated hydrolase 1
MNYVEEALVFPVANEQLLGILTRPESPGDCAVLIVVGGPQYRVGSHRQFVLLARHLAEEGFPTLRFDYRGMGDSDGAARNFEEVADDIAAAVDRLLESCPGVNRVVLWGLCDAASAALMYFQSTGDRRIAGLVLLNPWVRSEASLAQTHIKHYYGRRLMQKEFWGKFFGGRMQITKSIRDLLTTAVLARGRGRQQRGAPRSFQDRMAEGLKLFPGKVLLVLSGKDYTAKEFLEFTGTRADWQALINSARTCRNDIQDADHTFSSHAQRSLVECETVKWLINLDVSVLL